LRLILDAQLERMHHMRSFLLQIRVAAANSQCSCHLTDTSEEMQTPKLQPLGTKITTNRASLLTNNNQAQFFQQSNQQVHPSFSSWLPLWPKEHMLMYVSLG
jgi:hypothetical protein